MKKLTTAFIITISLVFCAPAVQAQQLPADSLKSFVLREWARAKGYTNEYLETMPADKYGFKATDSVRSFAQQMLHLAQGNFFLISMATGAQAPEWSKSDLEHSATASSKDSVKYYVNKAYDYCIDAISNLPIDKWGENVKTRFGTDISRFGLLSKGFEHQTHHRGQTTIYIRLAGIKPPNEKLF